MAVLRLLPLALPWRPSVAAPASTPTAPQPCGHRVPRARQGRPQAFDTADAECQRVSDSLPSSIAVASGEAILSDEQLEELRAARDARMAALKELLAVKRWDGDGGPKEVEKALRRAARAAGDQPPGVA